MDVADWLRSLGLERYEQAFRDNEIDAELLPNLTGEDLKDLGVSLVGHRRRLLDAIARLRDANAGGEAAAADRFAAKIQAWQVRGESAAESRFAARTATSLTPFVGRQHELGMLLDRFEQARESEGQVVLLSGEPGIGKSRLAHSLIEHLADVPHTRVRYYCSPFFVNSALHPIIEQLERAAAFEPDDPAERRLDKLEALLSQGTNDPAAVAPLFAALLSIPLGTRYPPLDLPAPRQRELTIAAIVDQLSGLAARQPVVMVVEDGHWLDPTTTELLERMIERVQTLPVLLLITFRPEFAPPWTSYPHMTSLTLNRLGRRHSTDMIAAVAGGKSLPEEVLAQISAKTEGVPLFVEELTKTVLESGLLEDKGDRYELIGPLPPLAIPATLQDSLMARLDRMAPVKEAAQIGAVIGREFSYRLLAKLSPLAETALQEALSHLVGLELVFRRGTIPDATYSFKHVFVQDAAYATLLKSKRQQLHAAAAEALREHFPEVADSQPELLAHHCTEAGLTQQAVGYWQRAGNHAAERSAYAEAAAHLSKGLDLLRAPPESAERGEQELDLLTSLGSILISTKGHGSPEVAAIYTRARDLCRSLGDTPHLAPVLQGQRMHHLLRAELQPARAAAEELLALGEQIQDTGCLLEGHRAVGVMRFYAAEFAAARTHLEAGIDLYDSREHRSHVLRYEGDPGQTCLSYSARTLWVLGYPEQAVARSEQGIAVAQATSHAATVAEALTWRTEIAMFRGEVEDIGERASAALTMATEHALPLWTSMTMIMQGWALSEQGQAAVGVARIREGLAALTATGDQLFRPYYLAMMAEALGRAGKRDEGLLALEEAIGSYCKSGVRYWDAELQRVEGELRLAGSGLDPVAAESCLLRAIEIARAQCAKSLELRAATSLARLWRDRGKRAEARDLLAPVYGWFTEGFDTADLKNAKALLDKWR
jgi:predicted ATPase